MKLAFLPLMILLTITGVNAQKAVLKTEQQLKISSLNTPFAIQGDFEGEYVILRDRIQVKLTKADVHISENCPYQGRRLLTALRFGLAVNTENNKWKIDRQGNAILPNLFVRPADTYNFGELVFTIPIDESIDLTTHWLVVEMEDVTLDTPEPRDVQGYAYAHSCRNIFTSKQCKTEVLQ